MGSVEKNTQIKEDGTELEKFELETPTEESFCEVVTSCRWVVAYVGCICFTIIYALRINMGIAIVCMVKAVNMTSSVANSSRSTGSTCAAQSGNTTSSNDGEGDIEWDKTTQGWILSSLFYGYLITQVPGGYLSGRFGGKRVMLAALLVYGVSTVVLPLAARTKVNGNYNVSAGLVIALRVIAGLSTGVVFPAMHNIMGKWAPKYERSKLNVLTFSGTMIGNILMLGVGGFFCEWTSFDGGWPSIFYMGGGVCLLFCLLWQFTIYDSPMEHPRISEKERSYIMRNLNTTQTTKNKHVPWISMITSPAVWAILVAHVCNNFGNYTLITKLPAFMKEVLQFDIKSNGLYSALPYIAMFLVANGVSQIIDKIREKEILSTKNCRKVAMLLAFVVPAGILVSTGHIPCDKNWLGVLCLTLAVAFTGFNRSGYNVNNQDIGPKYAGEIFGITNTFATVPGMVAPLIVNLMTPNGTQEEWQMVFYVWAAIFGFGALIFSIFAQGELQPWAIDEKDQLEHEKDNPAFKSEEPVTDYKLKTEL